MHFATQNAVVERFVAQRGATAPRLMHFRRYENAHRQFAELSSSAGQLLNESSFNKFYELGNSDVVCKTTQMPAGIEFTIQ